MATTIKQDWMNDFLAKNNFIVSSHSSINKHLNVNEAWDISIRFAGNATMGYTYLMVIIVEDNPVFALKQIKDNSRIINFISILKKKFLADIKIILCGKDNDAFLFYVSTDNIIFSQFNENSLATYFEAIDPRFTENIGTNKAINRSLNDGFQAWTRVKLSKYITVNDFDALYIKDNYFYIFELKRINPEINQLEDWRPYCKDYGNYRACNIIRQNCNLTSDMFRTIAYTLEDQSKISVFTFNTINQNDFRGNFDILIPKHIFDPLKNGFQKCK